jgi:hypothetical protein
MISYLAQELFPWFRGFSRVIQNLGSFGTLPVLSELGMGAFGGFTLHHLKMGLVFRHGTSGKVPAGARLHYRKGLAKAGDSLPSWPRRGMRRDPGGHSAGHASGLPRPGVGPST